MNYLNWKMGFYLQFITLFLCFTLALAAGKISPEMEKILSKMPPGSEITVLVKPAFEVEIYALNSELERAKITRAERHCRLIKELKRKSEAAQAGLLSELEKMRAAGLVREYKPFWIVNLVVVKATAQAIRKLAVIKEVSEILENKKVRPRTAEKKRVTAWSSPRFASTSNEFNWGLRSINAHRLWERGITGRGVLVAVIDFGIDGSHPGLKDKWRGANGASAEESFKGWFDSNGFPTDITPHGPDEPEQSHGTGTLGQLVGQDGADTVGVAPDAQWIAVSISANTLGDTSEVMHFLMLLEWLADPDSDPETVNDMPDILSISLYMVEGCPCNSPYDEAFSNLKALGVTPIFAAGNVGSEGSFTVIAPGTRPEFFAVGAVDRYDVVADFSSRGPSSCDKNIIKPDVVAPGVKTLSLRPLCYGEGYQEFGGTSGAAPLTAGVAALLKQYDPELTPDEIYNVLRKSAKDLGKPGPDNDYGWGLVNAEAALSMVEPPISPNFTFTGTEVNAGEDDLIYPGEKASVVLRLANIGAEAKAVTATLSSLNPDVTVTSAHALFGDLGTFEKAYNSEEPFIVEFSPQLPYSVKRTFFSLSVTSGDFSCTLPLALNVMHEEPVEPPKKGIAVHNAGKAALSLTNYGVIGRDNEQGGGFQYPYVDNTTPDHLYRGSLLIAAGLALVSDATFNESTSGYSLKFDSDFSPIPGGDIQITAPGSFADLEVTGIFSDNEAADPLGVRIYQRSYAWSAEADDDYVIVQYALRIPYGSESLAGVYVAQHLDWDVGGGEDSGEDDLVGFDSGLRLAYMYDNVSNVYVGHALLTHQVAGFRAINYDRDISDGFTGAEKFSFMTSGIGDTLILTPDDWSELLSTGPFYLKSDKETVVAFAIVGGMSLEELRANTRAAITRYKEIFPEEPEEPVASCDINGDGRNNILDVISLLLLLRDKPGDMAGDFNADGIANIFDAIALLVALRDGACPEAGALLSSANNYTPINMVEGLTREDVEYLKSVMAQLDLRAGEKEAFQAILSSYGKTCEAGLPEKLSLSRNVPNPFNPSTSIIYTVPEGPVVQITLRIYSIRGQLVCTLVDKTCEAGSYNVFWDGTDGAGHHVSSGVYFYRMQAGDFIQTRKLVLLK